LFPQGVRARRRRHGSRAAAGDDRTRLLGHLRDRARSEEKTMGLAPEHHFAEIGEVMLHYVVAGSGPPVVLLHGWPQTWFEWRETIAALAPRFTVIAPDMRASVTARGR